MARGALSLAAVAAAALLLPRRALASGSGRVDASAPPLAALSYLPARPGAHREAGELPPAEALAAWRLQGSAAPLDGGGVRLTEERQGQSGRMGAAAPAALQGRAFEADISVRVGGEGVSLAGDGLAVWYTRAPLTWEAPVAPAPADGSEAPSAAAHALGGPAARWTGLALFLDTYNNNPGRDSHPHPYISLMLNDGSLARDHDGSGTHSALHAPAGCSAQLRQVSSAGQERVLTLRLAYVGAERRVRLRYLISPSALDHVGRPDADWTECFDVSNVDLEL